jgi:hypothetical protein
MAAKGHAHLGFQRGDLLVERGADLRQSHHRGCVGSSQLGLTAAQRAFRAFNGILLALLIITPQARAVGPAPKPRQGITGTHPAKPPSRIHPGQTWIPGRGFTTGSGASGPQETPGHRRARNQLNDYAPSPAGRFAPPGWCC